MKFVHTFVQGPCYQLKVPLSPQTMFCDILLYFDPVINELLIVTHAVHMCSLSNLESILSSSYIGSNFFSLIDITSYPLKQAHRSLRHTSPDARENGELLLLKCQFSKEKELSQPSSSSFKAVHPVGQIISYSALPCENRKAGRGEG